MKKILVVDDDKSIAEALRLILEMNDYLVSVDDGTTVEEKIKTENPDVVLLDILLAGLDGRKICMKVKRSNKELPIILISAHADAANTYKKFLANDFLAKPFDMDDLLAKVGQFN